jgi:CDP-diglyceride synthetase
VRVDSALEQGATFTVVLPISRSQTAAGAIGGAIACLLVGVAFCVF